MIEVPIRDGLVVKLTTLAAAIVETDQDGKETRILLGKPLALALARILTKHFTEVSGSATESEEAHE